MHQQRLFNNWKNSRLREFSSQTQIFASKSGWKSWILGSTTFKYQITRETLFHWKLVDVFFPYVKKFHKNPRNKWRKICDEMPKIAGNTSRQILVLLLDYCLRVLLSTKRKNPKEKKPIVRAGIWTRDPAISQLSQRSFASNTPPLFQVILHFCSAPSRNCSDTLFGMVLTTAIWTLLSSLLRRRSWRSQEMLSHLLEDHTHRSLVWGRLKCDWFDLVLLLDYCLRVLLEDEEKTNTERKKPNVRAGIWTRDCHSEQRAFPIEPCDFRNRNQHHRIS